MTTEGEPGVGYVVAWVEDGEHRTRWFTGPDFSHRSKDYVRALLGRGMDPQVLATAAVFQLSQRDDGGVDTLILHDDFMPVLNHLLHVQSRGTGGLMQTTRRGRPTRTHAELRASIAGEKPEEKQDE